MKISLCLLPATTLTLVKSLTLTSLQNDLGILSLRSIDDKQNGTTRVVAGTKRGDLVEYVSRSGSFGYLRTYESVDSKSFPIYSVGVDELGPTVFCGGGDRFVSVVHVNGESRAAVSQKLGPHTGWVKDVIFDPVTGSLHSIGCNCIETWGEEDGKWLHEGKRSIESSVEDGSTLSSDLLCLAMNSDDGCFYAGGVDGRLHVWSASVGLRDPIESLRAHKGRVTKILFDSKQRLLFSCGYDGQLQCWSVSEKGKVDEKPLSRIQISSDENPVRITALTMTRWDDSANAGFIFLGSACGMVAQVHVEAVQNDVILTERTLNRAKLPEGNVVYTMLVLPTIEETNNFGGNEQILVGHSRGLHIASFR